MQTFQFQNKRERTELDWGSVSTISGPLTNDAESIVTIEVILKPGLGHNFHFHPGQEEVIYVIEGSVEQWVGEKHQILGPGDAVFIPADQVHASFNIGDSHARLLAILGPAVGEDGYGVVEVADQAPWNSLR